MEKTTQDVFQEFRDALMEFLWLVFIDPVVIPLIVTLTRALELIAEWEENQE